MVEQTIRSGRAQRHHSWPGTNFTDDTAARVVVEEGHSAFMILTRDFFQTFTDRPIGDPAVTVSVATAVFLDSREAVDRAVVAGIAAGGAEAQPVTDYGFMYQRQLTDPDGDVLVFGWMNPVAVGPRRYGELAAGLPGIPSNILAARLKELQAAGVLRRAPHSARRRL